MVGRGFTFVFGPLQRTLFDFGTQLCIATFHGAFQFALRVAIGIVEPMTGSLDSILVKAQTVVKDDVLLIASRPERSGGVHKGVFI